MYSKYEALNIWEKTNLNNIYSLKQKSKYVHIFIRQYEKSCDIYRYFIKHNK